MTEPIVSSHEDPHHNHTNDVRLGFLQTVPHELSNLNEFPSKVGGRPLWLNPEHIPTATELLCGCCDAPLACLLQLYAPLDDYAHAFHRYIYVFCCKNGGCHQGATPNRCIKVVRAQLPRQNPFYTEDKFAQPSTSSPSSSSSTDSEKRTSCRVCGRLAGKRCSACKQVVYCSQAHQVADWKARHSRECKSFDPAAAVSSSARSPAPPFDCLFPEFLVEDDAEDYDSDDQEDENDDPNTDKQLDHLPEEVKPTTKDYDPENYTTVVDKVFHTFRKRIELHPDQVLRYYCAENAEPLWVNIAERPSSIPACPHCNTPRHLELQILPQMLYYLKVDRHDGSSSVDWGTLLIYTCPSSCPVAGSAYIEEFCWRQNISKENEIDRAKMLDAVKALQSEKPPTTTIEEVDD